MQIRYDAKKDELLKSSRGVSFEDVKDAIAEGNFHIRPNLKAGREHQQMIIFLHNNYPHCCPFVVEGNDAFFLKTIYPAREYLPLFNNLNTND